MSLEMPEVPTTRTAEHTIQEAAARKRMGWAILALNDGKYHTAELHLTEATRALQNLQRLPGGKKT